MKDFNLEIYTPSRMFFSGPVQFVSLPAIDGEIGLLPNALQRVSPLVMGMITIHQDERKMQAVTDGGFMYVGGNTVTVMAGDCLWKHEALEYAEEETAPAEIKKRSEQEYNNSRRLLITEIKKLSGH